MTGKYKHIVLISEQNVLETESIDEFNSLVDATESRHTEEVVDGLKEIAEKVTHYESPKDFLGSVYDHQEDIVFPNWMGDLSRNRAALIPAICEAVGIRYVGGDSYTRLVCGDKALSKALILEAGLRTPAWALFRSEADFAALESVPLPAVVKPSLLNSSIGISQDNLVSNYHQARDVIVRLWSRIRQPVIFETFCPGKEVSVSLVGSRKGLALIEAAERYVEDSPDFFETRIFDVFLKKRRDVPSYIRPAKEMIAQQDLDGCEELFRRLEKVNMIRFDGRLKDGRLSIIELSPNPLLASTSEFVGAFLMAGYTYPGLLREIVRHALL